ncbi:MAG: Na+/H+ antiporter NhaA [Candidatus Heimdallarchaeota archaeon]|nr:Na+/H+ antiporter NhaA [Candidatus Heimdallarchaeota archaeon]
MNRPFPTKRESSIEKLTTPLQKFLKYEASSGIILIITIIVALVWVNINSATYFKIWSTYFTISLGNFTLSKEISLWINDLLMAIFFLLVGLEVKRELLIGELRDRKKAMLPISAALGGIVLPALIYLAFNFQNPTNATGWAIPAATDIAFALGILYLLGNRVPISARIFLATLAIIDDIVAILIIAILYTDDVNFHFIALAIGMFAILLLFNKLNVRRLLPYLAVGSVLWYGFFGSGIHATIAGIFLTMVIPATSKIDHLEFRQKSTDLVAKLNEMTNDDIVSSDELPIYMNTIATLEYACQDIETPLQRLEHSLTPWVAFLIMPIFALANAGVVISGNVFSVIILPISLGIIFGLSIGKPLGIFIASYLAVKFNIAEVPSLSWHQILGVGFLAGVGFTMSTFIAALAFEDNPLKLEISKVGILVASFLSGGIGFTLLKRSGQNSILDMNP